MQPIRVELGNYLDLQYYININVGRPAQTITSIVDTGSFELVIFLSSCHGCGLSGAFHSARSTTNRLGKLVTQLTYGSGDVEGDEATDLVSLGPLATTEQTFWQIREAKMPLLQHAKFQSILGAGPPETPAADAWDSVAKIAHSAAELLRAGQGSLSSVTRKNVEDTLATALEISKRKTVLSTFNVKTFSICLGREPGSKGYFIWNDTAAALQPEIFSRLPVAGKHSWTVRLTDVRLRGDGPVSAGPDSSISCQDGCGAVIDSGTSLLVAPAQALEHLMEALRTIDFDCGSAGQLPNIVLTLAGSEFTLTPEAYVSTTMQRGVCQLQLSAMEATATSELGPMWILGMPFLRRYYTTFNVGDDKNGRALFAAPAGNGCLPSKGFSFSAQRSAAKLRTLDRSKMYITPLVRKVTTEKFMKI